MNLLDGKLVKEEVIKDIKNEMKELDRKLGIAIIQVGDDPASDVYVRQKKIMAGKLNFKEEKELIQNLDLTLEEKLELLKQYENVGCNFRHIKLDASIKEEILIDIIYNLNKDEEIDGILVQLPIPKHLNVTRIINSINPNKDIDGLNDYNVLRLDNDEDGLVPCTALGVVEILKYYNIDIKDKNVVVVGRSNLVGKPVAKLLEKEGGKVFVCHSKTVDMKQYTKIADILVVAVGKKGLITEDMVKDGAVVVDVGINRIDGKLYGDVEFNTVSQKASYITPVPGGVGPMTIAMLSKNLLKAYNLKNNKKKVKYLIKK